MNLCGFDYAMISDNHDLANAYRQMLLLGVPVNSTAAMYWVNMLPMIIHSTSPDRLHWRCVSRLSYMTCARLCVFYGSGLRVVFSFSFFRFRFPSSNIFLEDTRAISRRTGTGTTPPGAAATSTPPSTGPHTMATRSGLRGERASAILCARRT